MDGMGDSFTQGGDDGMQEVLPPSTPIIDNGTGIIAADGRSLPSTAMTAGQAIDMLEDGQFSEDLHRDITNLTAAIQDQAKLLNGAGKVKGSISIKIDLVHEDGMFKVSAESKVVAPKTPRQRTPMWTDSHNRLTRFPPNQHQLFGIPKAGDRPTGPVRNY
jgi:hypothetical protein